MGTPRKKAPAKKLKKSVAGAKPADAKSALAQLKRLADKRTLAGLARYGIPSHNALGVPVNKVRALATELGRDHRLAQELWKSGYLEARMLATFVADPQQVTPAEMERWCRHFDSWAICDTVCFHLWDRTPHALAKVHAWAERKKEFEKRTAFALLASMALHDKQRADEDLLECLPLIEKAASDERNFVKKGVSWALRAVGRHSSALHAASMKLARRLSESSDATERWVGKDVLRDIGSPSVVRKMAAKTVLS